MHKLNLGEKLWRPDVALLGGALVLCIAIVVLNVSTMGTLREQTIRSTEANLKSHAIVLSEEADRSLRVLDVALLSIAERLVRLETDDASALEGRMTGSAIHQLLSEKVGGLSYVNAIALVGRDGQIFSSSRTEIYAPIDVADRDYVRAFASNPALTSYVSEPFRNRVSGAWMLALARRISTRSGEFAGLVIGTVTLAHFEDFFRSVALQDGSAIALVRTDGMLLARFPSSEHVGTVIAAAANMGRERTNGTLRIDSPIDHQTRIASARPLASYPLVIVVSQTEEGALRAWRELADHSNIMAFVRTLFVLFVALAAARWWRKQRRLTETLSQQNLRFDIALNNMSQGLCFFDGSQRLIVCNSRYLEMYGLKPESSACRDNPQGDCRSPVRRRQFASHVAGAVYRVARHDRGVARSFGFQGHSQGWARLRNSSPTDVRWRMGCHTRRHHREAEAERPVASQRTATQRAHVLAPGDYRQFPGRDWVLRSRSAGRHLQRAREGHS